MIRTVAIGGTATLAALALALVPVPAHADHPVAPPPTFTSILSATATPDQVVDDQGAPAPGQPGGVAMFTLRVNSDVDTLCFDIVLQGVTSPFQSAARTAIHLQEGSPGQSGNPRMVFPEPQPAAGGILQSTGCMAGPFTTGVVVDQADTGTGFTLKQMEENPPAWFVDVHTQQFPTGAVRGQLIKLGP